jgi:DDB1- and CUL4-associated factor 5
MAYGGHRSIVNNTLIHPHLPHILSSGIENQILLHSPTPCSPCTQNLSVTSTEMRDLSDADPEDHRRVVSALVRPHATLREDPEETDDELCTIALFDQ